MVLEEASREAGRGGKKMKKSEGRFLAGFGAPSLSLRPLDGEGRGGRVDED